MIFLSLVSKDFVQGIAGTTIYAERLYKINFSKIIKNSVCLCTIMEQAVIYLLMVQRFINKEAKDSEIVASP